MTVLSILIVNWNGGQVLLDCLESIFGNPPDQPYEVILVDNASTDASAHAAESRYPQVQVIHSPANLGFAGANNIAFNRASGEYLLLLNPDTVVQPGALQALLSYLAENSKAGAAGARLLNPDGSLQPSCSPEPTLSREFARLFHLKGVRPDGYYEMKDWDIAAPRRVDTLLGACLMVRRTAQLQIGAMDETFFMYSEEVDYCRRLRQAGWEICWVPQARVVHLGAQSTRQAASQMFLQLYLAKVQYFRKHYGRFSARLYKLILFGAGMARLAAAPLIRTRPSRQSEDQQALVDNYQKLLKALPGM
ncbi:MAG: hypothetical protein B6D39_02390 [Anaerolineae bacterium UTCFX2]|jgi:GT2 family glycosyltransferase|nr:glycosyltransferase family 2 protein [Anaerolineae bacterium]MCZ7551922.1 glycosyltransferase family 2 protein [Anaerolineales bacterium]OQY93930.1 MAG: hypothetical protein B6D39_02390 [Anaerolineae bacterium UTCFX2]